MIERYAIRHVDSAGVEHTWTTAPESVHSVARWHALDSGRPTHVLRWARGTWQQITVWTPRGEPDQPGYRGGWYDEPDDDPDDWGERPALAEDDGPDGGDGCPDGYPWPSKPVIDHAPL